PDPVTQVSIRYSLLERVPGTKEQVRVEPLKPKDTIMITAGVAVTLATVDSVGREVASLTLRKPIVAWSGMRVAVSKQVLGRWRLVGWGHIE
ncbi:MAG: translation initiation factor IF-2 subunit gamma, partial [Zestosphaera sp.]